MDGLMIPIMVGLQVLAETAEPITQIEAPKEGSPFIIHMMFGLQTSTFLLGLFILFGVYRLHEDYRRHQPNK